VDLLSAVVTLFLVMDPLRNVPLFLSILKTVTPERRRIVLLREIGIAYGALVTFLVGGESRRHEPRIWVVVITPFFIR
jgi:multiple antibiotic resistance protein